MTAAGENGPLNRRFVITGGPGSGKTTLLNALISAGYCGFPEVARELISGGRGPLEKGEKGSFGLFFESVLSDRISAHIAGESAKYAFYDRGIPDSAAYFALRKQELPQKLVDAITVYPYNPIVFVAPPWKEIYHTDAIRKESFDEASELHDLTLIAYRQFGYEPVLLPKTALDDRIRFILNTVERITAPQSGI